MRFALLNCSRRIFCVVGKTIAAVLFILNFIPFVLHAQHQKVSFRSISVQNGLSQNFVQCIYKDKKGYMWFGTRDGLNQYDGYKITTYRNDPNDLKSISNNIINDIIEDKFGDLLIATNKGINKWDRSTRSFIRYNAHNSILKVSDLLLDSKGRIWAGTVNAGLLLFDAGKGTFSTFLQPNPASNNVHKILEYKPDLLWIASKAGLDQLDIKTRAFSHFPVDPADPKKLAGKTIRDMYRDSRGTIWLGIYRVGLTRYNEMDQSFTTFTYNHQKPNGITDPLIWVIAEGPGGKLWLGTETKGICVFDDKTNTSVSYEPNSFDQYSLNHEWVRAILKDNLGNIWVGTKAGGINLLSVNRKSFQHITESPEGKGLNNKYVLSISEDHQNRIWLGTDGGGINIFDPSKNTFSYLQHNPNRKNTISSDIVYSVRNIDNQKAAIGHAKDRGLDLIDFKTGLIVNYPSDQNTDDPHRLSGRIVSCITKGEGGELWLGTQGGGVNILDLNAKTYRKFKRQTEIIQPLAAGEIANNVIAAIHRDREGDFWIGTDVGLSHYQIKKGKFLNVQLVDTEEPNVNCFYEQSDGFWIGTSQGLFFLSKEGKQTRFTRKEGLPSDIIKSILADKHGNLWLGTTKGLSRFDLKTRKFINYNVSDGLQSDEYNTGAAYASQNGIMYFGGINGFNFFHPDSLNFNQNPPPVVFTNFLLGTKEVGVNQPNSPLTKDIGEADKIELSYKEGAFISIEFAALDYTAPEKNQYAYQMVGFDKDWHYVGGKHEATYTNLSPGEYIFRVKASNNDGVWNEQGASVKIMINPPFWRTSWAYLIYLALVIAGLYFIFIQLRYRERLKNEVRFQKMTAEKMKEMSQMKLHFFTNVSHELRTPLSLIADPLRKIVSGDETPDRISYYSKLAFKNVKRLQDLVNQLLDFRKMEAGQTSLAAGKTNINELVYIGYESFLIKAAEHDMDYTINLPEREIYAWVDNDKLQKIVLNLISNAFKYTWDKGKIHVSLSLLSPGSLKGFGADAFQIQVSDTGIGIPPEHREHIFEPFYRINASLEHEDGSSGIGLAYTRELVLLHKGKINVDSTLGSGSEFIVTIPVGEEHFENAQAEPLPSNAYVEPVQPEYNIVPGVSPKENYEEEKPVILVVEDNKELQHYIAGELTRDFTVITADNGVDGFQQALDTIPDLIVSDLMMPQMNGFELCQKIKSDERTSHVPVILLTAKQSDESRIEGFMHGADEYIAKPFNSELLVARVKNILESRARLRELFATKKVSEVSETIASELDKEFLKKAAGIVQQHLSDLNFQTDDLATALNVSRRQLYRKLKAITNKTVHDFITQIRLEKSLELLQTGALTIAEIANEVGFSEPSNFTRTFTRQYKISPKKYISEKTPPTKE